MSEAGEEATTTIQSRTEERRAAVRQALGALSGLISIGLVAVDADGRSWYHNQRWEDTSGITGISLRGQPWYLAVHPEDRERVAGLWSDQARLRGRFGGFRVVDTTGEVRACVGETIPMVEADGTVSGYLIMVVDEDTTETQALSSGRIMEAVLEQSEDIITILNPDGSWRWSSGGALRLIGHQVEFDPAQGIFPFIHPDEVDGARKLIDRLTAEGGHPTERFEYRVRAADGTWRTMEALIDVLIDDPAVGGIVVHARDVTERRQTLLDLEASNQRLANLVTSMSTAVVLEDEERVVLLANRAFVDLFRLDMEPADLEGETLAAFGLAGDKLVFDPLDAAQHIATRLAERRPTQGDRVTLFDGRILEVDYVPMFVGQIYRGQLWLYRDVTDQARAEAERERLLASEREEHRRVAEIDAYRSEYLASVSHELRTPLTSIVGYTQMLRDLLQQRGASEELEYTAVIERNVERLFRLAGDLLLLDSLESGAITVHAAAVDVAHLVRHAIHAIAPEAAARGVRVGVDVGPGPPLSGDADRLGQLFDILLSNAVKFSESGGEVRFGAAPTSEGWEFEISDTGIGIPDGDQQLVFSRFYRGSNARTRGIPGRGLGLSIAHAVVELHRGSISVRSTIGSGTTFSVQLRGVSDDA